LQLARRVLGDLDIWFACNGREWDRDISWNWGMGEYELGFQATSDFAAEGHSGTFLQLAGRVMDN
jgi:predicted heme/steroid binding protein